MPSLRLPFILIPPARYWAWCVLMWCLAAPVWAVHPVPAFTEVRAGARPSVAVLLARDGTPIAERRLDMTVRRLEWVGLNSLSPSLKEALLAAEDKRFFEHSGVDWRAFAGSLWHNLWYERKRGASTLSMQLAGLLDPDLALGRGGLPRRSIGQKWDQAFAAQALEARWSKEQILEAYLNLAPFRSDLQGVHAASRALFNKTPGELGRPEALILAVLLRGPNARPEVVGRRACVL
ncbi:MAG: transglycosylase domain-containing protein, partial [Zoogloea sp.]|nr:transglycosylase domain-containing protein [Zoogloea sp.]